MRIAKIATTKSNKQNHINYVECVVITKMKAHGRAFILHTSYNSLLNCYMLSDYATGSTLKAFGLPYAHLSEKHIDRIITSCKEFLDNLTKYDLKSINGKTVNTEFDELPEKVNYDDVDLAKRVEAQRQKELEKALDEKVKQSKQVTKQKPKPKQTRKKRTTRKKTQMSANTLI